MLYLIPKEMGGVETYARSLIESMVELDNSNHYTVFLSRSAADLPLPETKNVERVVVPINNRKRAIRYVWEQVLLPLQAWRHRLDVLHSLNYVGPLWSPCKSIVTIHDANHCVVGDDMPLIKKLVLGTFSRLSATFSNRVVTVSEFSKSEIAGRMNIRPNKISVIYSGAGWNTSGSVKPSELPAELPQLYGITRPYLVAFGGGYVHKNIPRLLHAFQQLSENLDLDLVLIGRLAPGLRIADYIDGVALARVRHLGHIPRWHIGPILAGSVAFVFPSLYEGFGFPLLEAQAAGAPVVCSSAASIPEIAGSAAEYFNPLELPSITQAVCKVVKSPDLQQRLRFLAEENLRRFSWNSTAKKYLELYEAL